MSGTKLCSNGGLYPDYMECPPPFDRLSPGYAFENNPFGHKTPSTKPERDNSYPSAGTEVQGTISLSPGAAAGIIIAIGFLFMIMCLFALRFGSRWAMLLQVHRRTSSGWRLSRSLGHRLPSLQQPCRTGLDYAIVKMLPLFQYDEDKVANGAKVDCAVCLSPFENKEYIRILPSCRHNFHLSCIDRWFVGHSNCPLCREEITLESINHITLSSDDISTTKAFDIPSNDVPTVTPYVHQQEESSAHEECKLDIDHCAPNVSVFKRSLSTGNMRMTLQMEHHSQPQLLEASPTIIIFTKSLSLKANRSAITTYV